MTRSDPKGSFCLARAKLILGQYLKVVCWQDSPEAADPRLNQKSTTAMLCLPTNPSQIEIQVSYHYVPILLFYLLHMKCQKAQGDNLLFSRSKIQWPLKAALRYIGWCVCYWGFRAWLASRGHFACNLGSTAKAICLSACFSDMPMGNLREFKPHFTTFWGFHFQDPHLYLSQNWSKVTPKLGYTLW